jgi:HAMP domain-containing protein
MDAPDVHGAGAGSSHDVLESRLEDRMRSLRDALRAAREGDFSVRLAVDGEDGLMAEVAHAFNGLVGRNEALATELDRVSRAIVTQGDTSVRASLGPIGGAWVGAVGAFNTMVGAMAWPTIETTRVLASVAAGDLSADMRLHLDGHPARGDFARVQGSVSTVVRVLRTVCAKTTHVISDLVEGKLDTRADVDGYTGTWKQILDGVNLLADDVSLRTRDLTAVAQAMAAGDLSQVVTIDARGHFLVLKTALNETVERLRAFASEVIRVAREVGTKGKLGTQADVRGVSGVWKDLTDSVNGLASNLTEQVRNIALISSAIAQGDLSQKITVEAKGEILELKNTINAMVDQLRTFASEVTRVAREVGTEGKLGGQARVPGVAGTWQELTDSVNVMASNLTSQVRGIAKVVAAVADGDLSQRLILEARGEIAVLADTINDMTDTLRTFADQVTAVAREVGIEGKLGGQARVPGAAGTWRALTDSVNMLAGNLTAQVRNIALVTTAVANGDLSRKISVEAKGEILELKDTINAMVEQLRTFASEVTRVAREVGTDGQLGGQAKVPGVSGTWADLTDSVNIMASNLTDQVRGISQIVTAVANGDLGRRLQLIARGEIATLADTINAMTDTLRTFADQVTTVAREVGIEGKLGGQARVPGAAGTWRDLTDNVNQLAANLTTQVRAISEVATAVTEGDLTRTITVEARGEVLALKDTINQMIANLRDTTQTNKEQDWLKTNLARFFSLMTGQRSLQALTDVVMSELTPVVGAQRGAL